MNPHGDSLAEWRSATQEGPAMRGGAAKPLAPPRAFSSDELRVAQHHLDHVWYRPVRMPRPPLEQGHWDAWEDCSHLGGALPVAARSVGQGPTVLLLHGVGGRGSQFHAMAPAIARLGLRCLLIDVPGFGDRRLRSLTVHDIARVVIELDACEGGLHGVVAHSMASLWTWFAMSQGLRLTRFVALAGVPDAALCYALYQQGHGLSDAEMQCLQQLLALHEGEEAMARQDPARTMRALPPPAHGLIVQGAADDVVLPHHGQRYAAVWPAARYLEVPDAGHTDLLIHPRVLSGVSDFFASV